MVKVKGSRSVRRTGESGKASLPLAPDELLAKDNEPASKPVPDEIERRLSEQVVYISRGKSGKPIEVEYEDGVAKLRLPPGASLGRLGQASEFVSSRKAKGEARPTNPFRPAWCDYVYHPKLATPPPTIMLRRKSGRRVQPHTIYPPENRTVFLPTGYPMRCVGRLLVWDMPGTPLPQRSGTAVLVGSRVVLTSAHLMPRNGAAGMWGVLFVAGYFGAVTQPFSGIVQPNSWCEAYRVPAEFKQDDATQAYDVAVMKLYDPLGAALGWFGARTYDDDWEDEARWTLVGYPGDIAGAERPSMQNGIAVIDDDPTGSFNEIEHRGDSTAGNSGGPLFGTWPEGPYVIGVQSGFEYRTIDIPLIPTIIAEDNNVAAGGSGMVAMIRAARNDWP